MKQIFGGLDIGTSSVKAGLFDIDGHLLASAAVSIPLYSPFEGWAEQDPQDWWSAACQALKQVMEKAGSNEVVALGLSGQCPGHVLVDRSGKSLGRAIIWRDQRAQQEACWLAEIDTGRESTCLGGDRFLGEATMPPARLLWLKTHAAAELKQSTRHLAAQGFYRYAVDRCGGHRWEQCLLPVQSSDGALRGGLFCRLGGAGRIDAAGLAARGRVGQGYPSGCPGDRPA